MILFIYLFLHCIAHDWNCAIWRTPSYMKTIWTLIRVNRTAGIENMSSSFLRIIFNPVAYCHGKVFKHLATFVSLTFLIKRNCIRSYKPTIVCLSYINVVVYVENLSQNVRDWGTVSVYILPTLSLMTKPL